MAVRSTDVIHEMIDDDCILQHRLRAMSPENPKLKGSAQNLDVFFHGREAANSFYLKVPSIVAEEMSRLAGLTGSSYRLFDYHGHPAVHETVDFLLSKGEKVDFLNVHLYRPFSVNDFISSIPSSVKQED